MSESRTRAGLVPLLMFIAFFGIFVYGLLTALPGTVLPTLERNRYLPNDAVAGTFLLVNAIGAVIAYLLSGPAIDRIGKKFTLAVGALLAVAAMAGFALTVTNVEPDSALPLMYLCALALGLGGSAIVSAGHALVADVASSWRNSALNLLDVCFGLGLMTLPWIVSAYQAGGRLSAIFWSLAAATVALAVLAVVPRFPNPTHPESFPLSEAGGLLRSPSFWILALALFMYVGAEVALGKWVVTLLQRDPALLTSAGLDAAMQEAARSTPGFFEQTAEGTRVASFALQTLSWFGLSLIVGRLISSFLLGVMKMNSLVLLALGSLICSATLAVVYTAATPETVRWAVVATGIGMGPIFPTSVGLASVMAPRIAGTAMSLVMGIGFAGLLLIPPAVGYISNAVGGDTGDVRTGMAAVLAASVVMLFLHVILLVRERRALTPAAQANLEAEI